MISIVIPLYNKEDFILQTISSVLNQSFPLFEIIIVNDGSTDNSVAQIESLNDARIHLVSQPNAGVSAARNHGIALAKYDLIAFLDADDYWHPNFLAYSLEVLQQNPGVHIVGCNFIRVALGEEKQHSSEPLKYRLINNYFLNALREPLFCSSATVVRKSVFLKVSTFDTGLTSGEDLDLWFRIMLYFDGAFIENNLAYYTYAIHQGRRFDYLPTFEKHLVSKIMDKYIDLLEDPAIKNRQYAEDCLFKYTLANLIPFYFLDRKNRDKVKAILNKIPGKYKKVTNKNILFTIPYALGKFIFNLRNT